MAIDRDIELMAAVEFVMREKPHQGVFLNPADLTPGARCKSMRFVVGSLQVLEMWAFRVPGVNATGEHGWVGGCFSLVSRAAVV